MHACYSGLDWTDCGRELAPLEWHRRLMAASAAAAAAGSAAAAAGRNSMSPDAETGERRVVVLDCRNGYGRYFRQKMGYLYMCVYVYIYIYTHTRAQVCIGWCKYA